MTQGELERIPEKAVKIFSDLEIRIMDDIVRRIKINGFSTASADWQITRLQQLGKSEEDIKEWIRLALEASEKEIEKIFSDETYKEYMKHERAYTVNGMQQVAYKDNQQLQSLVFAVSKQTGDTFRNITQSMGFVKRTNNGQLGIISLTDFYRNTLDAAIMDIQSGAFDYQTVLKRTINDMTTSGIRFINFGEKKRDRIDVACRRAIMTGFRQVQGKINEQVAEELNTDSYEVTYHVGARPDHQPWQGKVWTMQQLRSVCGLGTVEGLHGANCYHDYRAFIPGVSVRAYSDAELERMIDAENSPKRYNGKEYTTYEALQEQRRQERNMRKVRQDIHLLREGGASEEDIMLKRANYHGKMQKYLDFSKEMKLPTKKDRIYQDGLKGQFDISEKQYEKVIKISENKKVKSTEKYKRLVKKSLDEQNKKVNTQKDESWKEIVERNKAESEKIKEQYSSPKLSKTEQMQKALEESKKKTEAARLDLINTYVEKVGLSREEATVEVDKLIESARMKSRKKRERKAVVNSADSDIMNSELGTFKKRIQTDKNMSKEYYSTLKDMFAHGKDDAKKAFNKYVPEDSVENTVYENVAVFNKKTKKISMHYGADNNNPRGKGATWFHEHGHLIDDAAGELSESKEFLDMLKKDAMNYRLAYGKNHKLGTYDKVDKAISQELNDMRKHSAVSDLLEGVTRGNIRGCAGHPEGYWDNESNITGEAFAHMFEAQFDKVRYEEIKKYFPKSLDYFEKKLKEVTG